MAAALAVLCGRSLSVSTLRQFASADTSVSRRDCQRDMHVRMGQLENLEKALAKMEPEELRKARLAAAAAAAAAVAVAAAAAADTTSTAAPTTGQCRCSNRSFHIRAVAQAAARHTKPLGVAQATP